MNRNLALSLLAVSLAVFFSGSSQAVDNDDKLSKKDEQALAIGRAILKLHELG